MSKVKALFLAVVAFMFAAPQLALAALPAGVGTGISGAQTDGLEAIGLLAVFGAALWLIHKVLRKLGIMG